MSDETRIRDGRQMLEVRSHFIESDRLQKDYGIRIHYLIRSRCLVSNSEIP